VNVLVGLIGRSPGWEELLEQEGATYAVADVRSGIDGAVFSAVAVTRNPDNAELGVLREYLRGGGAVIGSAAFLDGLGTGGPRREQVRYVVAEAGDRFTAAGLLDIDAECRVPREANAMRTQDNMQALFAGAWQGGFAVLLPFDPGVLIHDERAASRSFYFPAERLPAERIAAVGKAGLLHLLHAALEFLHHARGLPYVRRWQFPDGRRNLFAFRIDTDGAPQQDVDDLYRLARDHAVPLTWFLDVGAHDPWLRHFSGMVGQEFGVHCYEHVELTDAAVARKNLQKALHAMEREGLAAGGFAAPYGAWSRGLARVVDELGFRYSSEFSFAYDTLPLRTGSAEQTFRALQVPVHPICTGSMRRVGYAPERMKQYFDASVQQKLVLGEPLFYYHHPSHRSPEVIAHLFSRIRSEGIDAVTMGEYAGWWDERAQWKPEIRLVEGEVRVAGPVPDRVQLELSLPDGRRAVVPAAAVIRTDHVHWETRPPVHVPGDLRRTREFDPRALLGELFSTLSRKFS
jgi:peptidoglycan/xylan/chitin deacetylase (PgdA/CDA1 family)